MEVTAESCIAVEISSTAPHVPEDLTPREVDYLSQASAQPMSTIAAYAARGGGGQHRHFVRHSHQSEAGRRTANEPICAAEE